MQTKIHAFTASMLKPAVDIRPGDTVRVTQKIREGDKFRTQAFDGLVIAVKHGTGINATFTVRKVTDGYGVERIFPLHSPMIENIRVLKRADVRRAKLYYIREKAKREARKKIKQLRDMAPTASSVKESE